MVAALDELATLTGRTRAEQAAVCRRFLDTEHEKIVRAHQAGAPGDETARAWAYAADEVVRALFRAARAQDPESGGFEVSLLSVGGYGRAELCPYSDLDLWFLVPGSVAASGRAQALAEAVLYPLWDLRMEVGHAVRSVESALKLAREDLTACTALLDLRFLDGDRALFDKLEREVPKLFDREGNGFQRRLQTEKAERHARFGDTVFLLEPNVKNGEGGYRDLLTGLWAVKARYHVRDFPDLVELGQATPRQADALVEARRFYLTIRTAAHLFGKRKADRLTFDAQEAIAPELASRLPARRVPHAGDLPIEPAVAPAVEALMQQYFLHAKTVKRETDRLLERCLVEPNRKAQVRNLDGSFALHNGQLVARDPELFRQRPSEMMRIFNVALETGAELAGHTRDQIAEEALKPGLLAAEPQAGTELLRLLTDDRDARSPSLLEQAHDLGLLAAIMPEFAPCTARVQHDLYHVFTVDQHQLYAVAELKALSRGERAKDLPIPTEVMREVERKLPLYLGTLLHDVGKPLGKGHSETGARLAVSIARRFGLSDEDTSQTEFLVKKHLLLSHLSQRRDLNDVAMIANLAQELGDEESLRQLYLLTVCDLSMVAPGNMNEWKEQLLRELYLRTQTHFRGSHLDESDERTVVARRKEKVAELLGEKLEVTAEWLRTVPDRYIALTSSKQIARHIALSRRRKGAVALEVVHRPRKGVSELTVCTDDAPGLLARIAGVLLANRVDVLAANITSRNLPGGCDEAIDVFTTRDRYGRPITDPKRWERVEDDLRRVLEQTLTVERLIEERRERSTLPERVVPAVRTEIEVDNRISAEFSVVDVYTQDRLGVLYTITRTLADLQLDIHLSKVATEAVRVADVFYVREQGGGKLSADRVDEVKLGLAEALGRLQAGR